MVVSTIRYAIDSSVDISFPPPTYSQARTERMTVTESSPASAAVIRQARPTVIAASVIGVLLSLIVIAEAALVVTGWPISGGQASSLVMPLFVLGAMLVMVFVASVLIAHAARGHDH
jgi:hypothetical protein